MWHFEATPRILLLTPSPLPLSLYRMGGGETLGFLRKTCHWNDVLVSVTGRGVAGLCEEAEGRVTLCPCRSVYQNKINWVHILPKKKKKTNDKLGYCQHVVDCCCRQIAATNLWPPPSFLAAVVFITELLRAGNRESLTFKISKPDWT